MGLVVVALGVACDGDPDVAAPRATGRSELDKAKARVEALEIRVAGLKRALHEVEPYADALRGRPGSGTVVSIPRAGVLTWRCNDARRFSFSFSALEATVTVISSIDGEVRRHVVHPGGKTYTPFVDPAAHLEWTITYRHKPAAVSTGLVADPAVKQGACYVRTFTAEQTQAPN